MRRLMSYRVCKQNNAAENNTGVATADSNENDICLQPCTCGTEPGWRGMAVADEGPAAKSTTTSLR